MLVYAPGGLLVLNSEPSLEEPAAGGGARRFEPQPEEPMRGGLGEKLELEPPDKGEAGRALSVTGCAERGEVTVARGAFVRPVSQSVGRSLDRSVSRSIDRSVGQFNVAGRVKCWKKEMACLNMPFIKRLFGREPPNGIIRISY